MGTVPHPLVDLADLLTELMVGKQAEQALASDTLAMLKVITDEVQAARAAIGSADGATAPSATKPAHVQMGLVDNRGSNQLSTSGQYSGDPSPGQNQSGGANDAIG